MPDSLGTRTRFVRKWRHLDISTLTKWMYRNSTIWNLLDSLRAFFHKWLKWRRYSPFAYMLLCKLTPPDLCRVHTIVFYRKSEFCIWITSLHIQHWIYVQEFFVYTMKKFTSTFCNVSFAGQYILSNGINVLCTGRREERGCSLHRRAGWERECGQIGVHGVEGRQAVSLFGAGWL